VVYRSFIQNCISIEKSCGSRGEEPRHGLELPIREKSGLGVFCMSDIEEKISGYFKSREEVIAVYLFGSYPGGKAGPSSDTDIGILLDKDKLDYSIEIIDNCMVNLGKLLRKDIHPVILNFASEELLRQIFVKGKCILINDSRRLSRFKMVKFAQIADFAYYRKQMQSGLIRKVMGS
jgi:predicted nucleotidyltransferase